MENNIVGSATPGRQYYAKQPRQNAPGSGGLHVRRGIIRISALWALCRYRHKAHWTGSEPRLNREKGARFGDKPYAFEELIAELSAAMSCAEFGISCTPRLDHAHYLNSWLKVLKDDKRAIFTAAAAASAATNFIKAFSQSEVDDLAA